MVRSQKGNSPAAKSGVAIPKCEHGNGARVVKFRKFSDAALTLGPMAADQRTPCWRNCRFRLRPLPGISGLRIRGAGKEKNISKSRCRASSASLCADHVLHKFAGREERKVTTGTRYHGKVFPGHQPLPVGPPRRECSEAPSRTVAAFLARLGRSRAVDGNSPPANKPRSPLLR